MKYIFINLFYMIFLISGSCDQSTPSQSPSNGKNVNTLKNTQMTIKIGSKTFEATLEDNATATALKALLPLTLNMIELNGNEKYVDLGKNLPTNAANPKTIQNGDLMLYGSKTLVLFYKTFSTPYSYTKLGRITDTTGLVAALGKDDVTVRFELK
jgi:hypothetical protein